jgi:hypothetical protein
MTVDRLGRVDRDDAPVTAVDRDADGCRESAGTFEQETRRSGGRKHVVLVALTSSAGATLVDRLAPAAI